MMQSKSLDKVISVVIDNLMGKQFDSVELNCFTICQLIYKHMGINLSTPVVAILENIDDLEKINQLITDGKNMFEKIDKPDSPCLVLFYTTPPFATHLGFVLPDNKRFIHMSKKHGLRIDTLDNPLWSGKIEGFYKWKEK